MQSYQSKKILVVEDDDMNFIYIRQLFKILEISFERVKNGNSAIENCQKTQYDAIMMDIQLPGINGYDTTRKIREFNSTIPIIAQTASVNPYESDLAFQAGCNDILVKPFKIDDLRRVLNKIF
jgi:CheY-like chemotaxis protein